MHKALLVRTSGSALLPAFTLLAASFFLAPLAASAAPPAAPKGHLVREDIEWLDLWLPNTNNHDLPRVLLVGDSVANTALGTVAASSSRFRFTNANPSAAPCQMDG